VAEILDRLQAIPICQGCKALFRKESNVGEIPAIGVGKVTERIDGIPEKQAQAADDGEMIGNMNQGVTARTDDARDLANQMLRMQQVLQNVLVQYEIESGIAERQPIEREIFDLVQLIEPKGPRLLEGMPASIDADKPASGFALDRDAVHPVAAADVANIVRFAHMIQHYSQYGSKIVICGIIPNLVDITIWEVSSYPLYHVKIVPV